MGPLGWDPDPAGKVPAPAGSGAQAPVSGQPVSDLGRGGA